MKLPLPKRPPKKTLQAKTIKHNVADLNRKLNAASQVFRAAIARLDYQDDYQPLFPAYKLMLNHAGILMDMAYT